MEALFSFLKHPLQYQGYSKWKAIYFFQFLILYLILASPGNAVNWFANDFLKVTSKIKELDFKSIIIPALLIAPIGEELIFRLILKNGKHHFLIFFVTCILLFSAHMVFGSFGSGIFPLTMLFLGGVIYIIQTKGCVNFYSHSIFPWLFYGSATIFGLVHGTNFNYPTSYHLLLLPFLVIPQLVLGILLGFIRIKFGLRYAISFHFLVNAFGMLMLWR